MMGEEESSVDQDEIWYSLSLFLFWLLMKHNLLIIKLFWERVLE